MFVTGFIYRGYIENDTSHPKIIVMLEKCKEKCNKRATLKLFIENECRKYSVVELW